jgi:hypothetical protein
MQTRSTVVPAVVHLFTYTRMCICICICSVGRVPRAVPIRGFLTPHVTCFGFPAMACTVLTLHNKPPSQQPHSSFPQPISSLLFHSHHQVSSAHLTPTSPLHFIDRSAPCISDPCSFVLPVVSLIHLALSVAENKLGKQSTCTSILTNAQPGYRPVSSIPDAPIPSSTPLDLPAHISSPTHIPHKPLGPS